MKRQAGGPAAGVEVVPIRTAHLSGFRACMDSVAKEKRYIAMLKAPPLARVREFVTVNIERGTPQFVALDHRVVVGWCDVIAHRRPGFMHGGTLGMGVRATHRRRGIGSRLLSAALAAAAKVGLLRVELEVYSSNAAAIALYERFGFVREGRKVNARLLDGEFEDLLLMARFSVAE